jgi:broad specificity phosphatase PhoE
MVNYVHTREIFYVFARHGETPWNVKQKRQDAANEWVDEALIQGATDIPLNEKGREQAAISAKIIKASGYAFKKIITSPLSRALETAEAIAKEIGIHPQKDAAFSACSWGVCEGRTKPFRGEKFSMDYSGNFRGEGWEQMTTRERWKFHAVPESETTASLIERMEKAMMNISTHCQVGEEVLIVTHQENMKSFTLHCQADIIEEARLKGDLKTIIDLETTEFKNCSLHRVSYNLDTKKFTYLGEDKPKSLISIKPTAPDMSQAKAVMGVSFEVLALDERKSS